MTCTDVWEDKRKAESTTHKMLPRPQDMVEGQTMEEPYAGKVHYVEGPVLAPTYDKVNNPPHYNHNHKGIECIAAMEAMLSPEEFIGYLRGNSFKYRWRFRYKNGIEDLQKAQWYENMLQQKYKELRKK